MMRIKNLNNRKEYKIIDHSGENYLLQEVITGNYTVALGFRASRKGWAKALHFGNDLDSIADAMRAYQRWTGIRPFGIDTEEEYGH